MTCPYCSKSMHPMGRLLIHMEVEPQEGNRNIETCPKLQQNDTPRDKWAKILLRKKGNIHEVQIQGKIPTTAKRKLHTKATDRRKEAEVRRKRKTTEMINSQKQHRRGDTGTQEEKKEKTEEEAG